MKHLSFFLFFFVLVSVCAAKTGEFQRGKNLSKDDFSAALDHCETNLPKVWSTLNAIRENGVNVRLTSARKMGPGKSAGTDQMVISTFFLTKDLPKFPEDRLVIVLLHEFGHNLFNRQTSRGQRNPVKNEFFAFAYSIKMAQKRATKGDSGPLDQVIKNIKIRHENGKPHDPHTIAIKQLLKTPLWTSSLAQLESKSPPPLFSP